MCVKKNITFKKHPLPPPPLKTKIQIERCLIKRFFLWHKCQEWDIFLCCRVLCVATRLKKSQTNDLGCQYHVMVNYTKNMIKSSCKSLQDVWRIKRRRLPWKSPLMGQWREMVFGLTIPYGIVSMNLKRIFIHIIIYGDIHTFRSLGVLGEYVSLHLLHVLIDSFRMFSEYV